MDVVRTLSPGSSEVDPELVDRELASGVRSLRFSPPLERLYEEEHWERDNARAVSTGSLGLLLYNLFLLADYLLIPDVMNLALVVRTGIVSPVTALLLFVKSRSRNLVVNNLLGILIMMLMTAGGAYIMDHSDMPERELYNQGVLLIIIYAALIHRPAFWAAIIGTVCVNIVFSVGLLADGISTLHSIIAIQLIVIIGSIFTLVAAYWMERESRLYYLLSLKARLHSVVMEGISNRDALTGLFNRRALDRRLADLPDRLPGWQENLAVIIMDIDHFKVYNDRLGHQAGDDCLRQVASFILSHMREGRDQAFRFGGEEFLLLINETDADRAIAFAETIREAIERQRIPHPESSTGAFVTASFGVAPAEKTDASPTDVIARADMALYAAKNNGRNCVWPRLSLRLPTMETVH